MGVECRATAKPAIPATNVMSTTGMAHRRASLRSRCDRISGSLRQGCFSAWTQECLLEESCACLCYQWPREQLPPPAPPTGITEGEHCWIWWLGDAPASFWFYPEQVPVTYVVPPDDLTTTTVTAPPSPSGSTCTAYARRRATCGCELKGQTGTQRGDIDRFTRD